MVKISLFNAPEFPPMASLFEASGKYRSTPADPPPAARRAVCSAKRFDDRPFDSPLPQLLDVLMRRRR